MTTHIINSSVGAIAPTGPPWPQRIAHGVVLAAAGTLIGASAWIATGYSHALGLPFALAALGGEVIKPFAMAGAFNWRRPVTALACLAVALVCVLYNVTAELAQSATSRGDLAAERQAEARTAKSGASAAHSAEARRSRAEAELAGLNAAYPKDRAVAVLEPLANPARVCLRKVIVSGGDRETRTVCHRPKAASGVTEELARAKRRTELEAIIAAEKEADPLAGSIAFYAATLGFPIEVATVARLLNLVPVFFIEIGSAFSLVVAQAFKPPATIAARQSWWRRRQRLPATLPAKPATIANRQRLPRVVGKHPVLVALEAAGRPLNNLELAAAMGCHPGEATKRRREVAHLVTAERRGRELAITLGKPLH